MKLNLDISDTFMYEKNLYLKISKNTAFDLENHIIEEFYPVINILYKKSVLTIE